MSILWGSLKICTYLTIFEGLFIIGTLYLRLLLMIYLDALQEDVFEWQPGNPCPQPLQLNASHLEHCPYLKGHDYFQVRQYNNPVPCTK